MKELLNLDIDFLWDGDIMNAQVLTDGYYAEVQVITDEMGNVPDEVTWDMIDAVEMLTISCWMDEQATFKLSTETH